MTKQQMKIDGKEIANKILLGLKKGVEKLKEKGIIPHLAILLIDHSPASDVYVNQKRLKGESIGVTIEVKRLSPNIQQSKLLSTIQQYNNDNNIHGIIVQRPLPSQINKELLRLAIEPKKDVDGFHPNSKFQPPLAGAVLRILEASYATPRMVARQRPRLLRGGFREWLTSKNIVIIGKGETGGKPMIDILKKMGIDPKIIDSNTKYPEIITKKADIIISCVGKENIVKPEMLKEKVILIGVGLHRGSDGRMHGDYDEEKIKNLASFYTPTPGGVGPVNVAMLLENLVTAAVPKRRYINDTGSL